MTRAISSFLTIVCLFVFILLLYKGCSSERNSKMQAWMENNGKIKVLSTISMIDDLVKQIGAEYVDSHVLIKGDLDPHSYQLVKGDDETLAFADLIFFNGLGLEHGPSLQNYLSKQSKAIALGNKIQSENPQLVLYYKGQLDPHIWMDISLWAKTIPHIVEALSLKDPQHASSYHLKGNQLLQDLDKAHQKVKEQLHQIPSEKRYLVTSHDAFNYFNRAYLSEPNEKVEEWQARFAAPEGLAPESQLSTADIQMIIDHLAHYKIHVIFPESNVSRDSIRKIVQAAKEKGLEVKIAQTSLYADAMGPSGSSGDTYLKMINHNAKTIADYLQGEGT